MLEVLVKVLKTAPHMHWRFQLMVIDAVTVMIRDDVQTPMTVWECIFDGMVSDNSHVREACVPALGSALELIQDRQRSKEDRYGDEPLVRFPDKTFERWNGPAPAPWLKTSAFDARKRVVTPEYTAAVRQVVTRYFEDAVYLAKLTDVMSVVQLGRYHSRHRTATHCNTLQRPAVHCNALPKHCNALLRTATHTAAHTATRAATHTAAHF